MLRIADSIHCLYVLHLQYGQADVLHTPQGIRYLSPYYGIESVTPGMDSLCAHCKLSGSVHTLSSYVHSCVHMHMDNMRQTGWGRPSRYGPLYGLQGQHMDVLCIWIINGLNMDTPIS